MRFVPATHEVWVTKEAPQKGQVEILKFSAGDKVLLSRAAAVKVAGGGGPESLAVDPVRSLLPPLLQQRLQFPVFDLDRSPSSSAP